MMPENSERLLSRATAIILALLCGPCLAMSAYLWLAAPCNTDLCSTSAADGCASPCLRLASTLAWPLELLLDSGPWCSYGAYLFFQLKTHGDFFSGEDNDEQPSLSLSGALALLTAITLVVAVASECASASDVHGRVLMCNGLHHLVLILRPSV